jgi:hypothetical protein
VQLVNYSPNAPIGTAGHRFIDRAIRAPFTDDGMSEELSKTAYLSYDKTFFLNILYYKTYIKVPVGLFRERKE